MTIRTEYRSPKKTSKIMIRIVITITMITLSLFPLLAQGPGGPPATPIDGGLSLLLAAGGVYGLKKLMDRRK